MWNKIYGTWTGDIDISEIFTVVDAYGNHTQALGPSFC